MGTDTTPVFGKAGESISVSVNEPTPTEGVQRTIDLNACKEPDEIDAPVPISFNVDWIVSGLDATPSSGSGTTASFTASEDGGSGAVVFTAHPSGTEPCSVPDAKTQRPVYAFKLVTETEATQPSDQTRRTIGVAEKVTISVTPAPPSGVNPKWEITAKQKDAKLSTDEGQSTELTGSSEADSVTVKCSFTGFSDTVTFQIIEPQSVLMIRVADPFNPGVQYEHSWGTTGVKIWAQAYIGPDSVSFKNIVVWEGEAIAQADGILQERNGTKHDAGGDIQLSSEVVSGRGTKDSSVDNISLFPVLVFPPTPPFTPGTFLWNIPWNYKCPDFPNFAGKKFKDVPHKGKVDADGTIHLEKAGAEIHDIKIQSPNNP